MDFRQIYQNPSDALEHLPASTQESAKLMVRAASHWIELRGAQWGASIAFYTMFAVAPLLVVAIAVAGAVFGPDAARGQIVGEIEGLTGPVAARAVEAMIESAWRHPSGPWASVLGVITLLVGATGAFTELRRALNAIGHVKPMPTSAFSAFVRIRLTGLALVLGFGFLAIVSLLLSAVLAALGSYFSDAFPGVAGALALFDFVISTTVLTLAFGALLRWLPDVPPAWRGVWLGAVSSAALFSIGKHLIGQYLARASLASSYGAAGSFVVLMLWVYYSAQILLFGGALAAAWEERRQRVVAAFSDPAQNGGSPALP